MFTRTTRLGSCTAVALIALALVLSACGSSSSTPPAPTTGIVGATGLDEYVQVTLRNTAGGADIVFNALTDGTFGSLLAAGTYDMLVARPGYENWTEASVTIVQDQTTQRAVQMVPMAAKEFVGSENCGVCHTAELAVFMQSGHQYKLNKIVNDSIPLYPFSSIAAGLPMMADTDDADPADTWPGTENQPNSTPATYADISYVIGGFGWKARWIDKNGYIVTGTNVQYNLDLPEVPMVVPATPATMTSYHNNETNVVYNCGNCHTTGWKHYDGPDNGSITDFNLDRQDNLPGMDGTFFAGGVHCEACHGAGSTHAQTSLAADITLRAVPLDRSAGLVPGMYYGEPHACGDCHTRDGEKDYPSYVSAAEGAGWTGPNGGRVIASFPFIKHHEQGDEILGLNPNETAPGVYGTPLTTRSAGYMATHGDCLTCHDQHATTKYQDHALNTSPDGVKKSNADCMVCHASKDPQNSFFMKNLLCIDCHMPRMVKSARAYAAVGGAPALGDIKTHLFKIDMTKSFVEQFTSDNKFVNPYITSDFACVKCHNGGGNGLSDKSGSDLTGFTFH